jgi:hypothetical protein
MDNFVRLPPVHTSHRRRFYYDQRLAENVANGDKSQEKRSGVLIHLYDREALSSSHAYYEHAQNKQGDQQESG